MAALEREHGLPAGGIDLIPTIETATGYCNIGEIVRAARRVRRLSFGAGDFTTDLGLAWTADEAELMPCRSAMVAHSRAAGLEPPIDTPWAALKDSEGFARSVRCVNNLGFQGKLCIHPDQVPVVNASFGPSAQQVAHAQRVLAAFAQSERDGVAAIQVDGQFVDYPVVLRAQRIVDRAEAVARASSSS